MSSQREQTTGSPPMIGDVLTVQQWREKLAGYDFGTIPPTRVVLHHTYVPDINQWRGMASMRGMQRYYAGKGWKSAPHIYVGPESPHVGGNIWLFTPMRSVGIHAGKGNAGYSRGKLVWYSIGVEMVGYYDHRLPSGNVWEGTLAVLGGLSMRLNISPRKLISFHRDYPTDKTCPGSAVTHSWVWTEVERWIAARAAEAAPPPLGRYRVRFESTEVFQDRRSSAPVAIRLPAGELVSIGDIRQGKDGELWAWIDNGTGFLPLSTLEKV